MKKLSVLMTVAVAVWMMASCGGKTQQVPFDDGDSAEKCLADCWWATAWPCCLPRTRRRLSW